MRYQLQQLAIVSTNMTDADFWIQRKGSVDTVGKVSRSYNPESIGVKVKENCIVDPNWLFYLLTHAHTLGFFKTISNGTTNLVSIKISDVRRLGL